MERASGWGVMTPLEMKAEVCRRIIEECQRQMDYRDSLVKGTEERRRESLILEGLLRAASIATDN